MIVSSYPPKKAFNQHIYQSVLPKKHNTIPTYIDTSKTGGGVGLRKPEPKEIFAATKRGLPIETFIARDNVIKMNAKGCPFKPGEIVWPRNQQDQEMFGRCRILAIVDKYLDFGDDEEWPPNNVPRIVHFEVEEPTTALKNKHFFGTINFFERIPTC